MLKNKKVKVNYYFKRLVGIVIIINILLFGLCVGLIKISKHTSGKLSCPTIVIDAGHGGRDGGSVGVNGTIEKEINLRYALALKTKLEKAGCKVILTRKDDNGLYDESASNKKLSDMKARLNTIENANPNLVISIHMNSFPIKTASGANCYYRKGDSSGEQCANLIQKALSNYCNAKSKLGKVGDYYMLNCSYYTSVLVECGFISNPEEEQLLNTPEYEEKVVYSIYAGILLYLGINSYAV